MTQSFPFAIYGLVAWLQAHRLEKDCRIVLSFPTMRERAEADWQIRKDLAESCKYAGPGPDALAAGDAIKELEIAGVKLRLESRMDK